MHFKTTNAIATLSLAATSVLAQGKAGVLVTYADIAQAAQEDSLVKAQSLQHAVDALLEEPSAEALQATRTAWLEARVPYQHTEVYRFGNAIFDDWEGKVNAWPLDEGLIDCVDASYGGPTDENQLAALSVVANPTFILGGEEVDATDITPAPLEGQLHEAAAVEANVPTC